MEAARLSPLARGNTQLERDLARLRPFGEAFVMKNFGDQLAYADAEDAVSDVTLRLHRQIAAGNPPDNLQAAFLTGCSNAAIDRIRRHSRKPTVGLEVVAESAAQTPAPEEEAERRETSARVREVLLRTSPRQRQVLILRFGLGLTVPEIAARMNTSLPAAKNLLARGIASAREQLEAIEGRSICPEIQATLRDTVFDRELARTADEDEARQLHAHLDHCGPCKSFLASLHHNLNEIGSGALLAATSAHSAPLGHLSRWTDHVVGGLHALAGRARLAAYKLGGALSGDGAAGGTLVSTGQKALAVCGATATTATCLATGIVGPGVGVLDHHQADPLAHHHSARAAQVRQLSELPPVAPQVESEATAPPDPSPTTAGKGQPSNQAPPPPEPEPEPAPTPAQQGAEEFGVESTAPPPEPEPAPSAPSTPSSSGGSAGTGGGGGGGGESFGFGG